MTPRPLTSTLFPYTTLFRSELLYRMIRYAIERKKAEHERENLLREQIASRELEAKRNEFISMVVHELKTPLTSLKSSAQDRKSTRLNSSHPSISYAVFCLKK